MVSNSRRTPWATPAASFIRRAASSKNRLLVWVIGASALLSVRQSNNGHRPPQSQEQDQGIVKPAPVLPNLTSPCSRPHHRGQPPGGPHNAPPVPAVSRLRSGADLARPVPDPLVCARLYRRHPARLVLCA